jgi:hypothetical protein
MRKSLFGIATNIYYSAKVFGQTYAIFVLLLQVFSSFSEETFTFFFVVVVVVFQCGHHTYKDTRSLAWQGGQF